MKKLFASRGNTSPTSAGPAGKAPLSTSRTSGGPTAYSGNRFDMRDPDGGPVDRLNSSGSSQGMGDGMGPYDRVGLMSEAAETTSGARSNDPAKRYGSCYEGGANARCDTCKMVKIACNCQSCHCCHRFLMSPSSIHHCRLCWRATCAECSNYMRTNDFMGGRITRTCLTCAVPKALIFITQMRYSVYDSAGPNSFRWGLYVLGCEIEAPRRCINPLCSSPFAYVDTCAKCKSPTVTILFHEQRHIATMNTSKKVAKLIDSGGLPSGSTEALEDVVRDKYETLVESRSADEVDEIFACAMPLQLEKRLFSSLAGNIWATRKVLLALVACGIAGEAPAAPVISLAMTDFPVYARVMRPLQITELFTVFSGPGNIRLVAFSSGASRRPGVHQVLSTRMVSRELWTSQAMKSSEVLGKIVSNKDEAQQAGLNTNVATWNVREGLLGYISDDNIMLRVQSLVLRMVKNGEEVVLCGHGIGGAVASWLTTCMLLENTPQTRDRLLCVTFGAPLIASRSLSNLLMKNELAKNYQNFVNGSDMVPRLGYVDSLLYSGNAASCASILGQDGPLNSVRKVRDCVVLWTASHEEPRGAAPTRNADDSGDGNPSASNIGRNARYHSVDMANGSQATRKKDSKRPLSPVDPVICVNETEHGDLFLPSREPFDNNAVRTTYDGELREKGICVEGELTICDTDLKRYSTTQHRDKQAMDPLGCYHFLWQPRGKYICTEDPTMAIGLLSDRTNMRLVLRDHLLSAYNKGMMEYVYSAPP
ncbi:Lipase (class 3) family protein [Leishmania donovani]|uniref:Lipase (Class 3) family protein n=1 Tax=Leishmania donovani TaxID=5661 RepID=A0A504XP24_LEIDO|nr:Lipase (class 3) family protein [Leishmania donovani]